MGTAVPIADPAAAKVLSDARSQATAGLKGDFPESMLAPPPAAPPRVSARGAIPGPAAPPPGPAPEAPPPDATDVVAAPPPTPPPTAEDAPPSYWDAVKDETAATGRNIGAHAMAGFAKLGRAAAILVGAPITEGVDAATGGTGASDALFGAVDKYVNTAVDYWQKQAEDDKASAGARIIGQVAEMAAPLLTGAAAPLAFAGTGATDAGVDAIQQGQDAATATKLALVAAFTNAAGMKIPMKSPNVLKRIATGIGGNMALTAGSEVLAKKILASDGYKEAANKIDPLDPTSLTTSGIMGAIFGAIGEHGGALKPGERAAKGVEPDLEKNAGTAGNEPPPPPAAPPVAGEAPPVAGEAPPAEPPVVAPATKPPLAPVPEAAPVEPPPPAVEPPPPAAEPAAEPAKPAAEPPAPAAEPAKPEPAKPEPAAEAPAAEPTGLKAGDRRIVKIAGEDVPVVVDGPAVDGKVPVRTIDEDGRVDKSVRQVPEHMLGETKPAEPVSENTQAPEQTEQAAAAPAEAPSKGPSSSSEPAPAAETPPEKSASETESSGLAASDKTDLKSALDQFKAAEQVPAGKKFAGKLPERTARVAEFARAVKAAAAKFKGDAAITDDATKAAGKAERLDSKTPEAIAKNQGVGHTELSLHAKALQRAAENMLLPHLADTSALEAPKAVKLKARIAAGKKLAPAETEVGGTAAKVRAKIEAAKEPAPKPEPPAEKPKLIKTAIKDVEDLTKPKVLNRGEQAKITGVAKRFFEARGKDVPVEEDRLQSLLHEIYGPERAHEAEQAMQVLRDHRGDLMSDAEEAARPRRMSDTVEDEQHEYGGELDEGHEDTEADYRRENPNRNPAGGKEWNDFHSKLEGFYNSVMKLKDAGKVASTHKVLDAWLQHADPNSSMYRLFSKLRENVPDRDIHIVDEVKALTGARRGEAVHNAAGSYTPFTGEIQIKLKRGEIGPERTMYLAHEIVHAATSDFVLRNPDHPLTKEINRLHQVARDRAAMLADEARRNGEEIPGLSPSGGVPAKGDFYGLLTPQELMAEATTNPRFQKLIARSEKFANIYEGLRNVVTKIGEVISKMIGLKNPKDTQLLHNVLDTTGRIMEAQRRMYAGETINTPRDRLEDVAHYMAEEPPPLPREDRFRGIAGEHATQVARLFRRAVRSGTVDTLRRNVRAFTSYSQLVRAGLRRGVFGHADDPTNPLRAYDEANQQREIRTNKVVRNVHEIVQERMRLSRADDKKLGEFQRDSTMYGIDPTADKNSLPKRITADPKFNQRWQDFQDRWNNLSDAQKSVYEQERDWNEQAIRDNRKAGIDVALDSFSDKDIPAAQRRLLYSVSDPSQFESIVGHGKEIDVGDRNDRLVESLKDLASNHELEGPYFHLGRHGDHVVQIEPEGTKTFGTQREAEGYADRIRSLSPKSKAKVAEVGGQWQVDYKAQYVSMHETPEQAQQEIERLRAAGYDVGSATTRILSERNAPISAGFSNIVAEVNRRITRRGEDESTKALSESLRQAFVGMMAARSAYAGSKLARRNVGGVKGEEMGRNFATHAQSLAWNTGHLATVIKTGEALGRLREATKDSSQPQDVADARGRVYDELSRRMQQEVSQYGQHTPFNSLVAKVGFLNYLTSASHAIVNLTQNFTTAIPTAMARHGAGSAGSFAASMRLIASPAFRETFRAHLGKTDAEGVLHAIVNAVAKDRRFGKWAAGGDASPLQQLIDRGAIHTSFSNQLATVAKGGGRVANKVFDYARLLPALADTFNRVSTGLAALEFTKGDIYKAADFVRETHMDYSQAERPRAFRAVSKLWGGNSIFMFKTYMQGMAHLLYSHIFDMAGAGGNKTQALKTVAGVILGTSLFAGVQRGAGLEPLRLAMYAYNKLVGDDDEYHNFDNSSKRWVHDVVGNDGVADVINGGLPRAAGFDMSSRLGLSDLFFHDPPDLLGPDDSKWEKFGFALLGPAAEELKDQSHSLLNAFATGRTDDFVKAIPVKIIHNVFDAYRYGTEGKVSASGAQLTQPSAGAAVTKLLGFKTAEEARIQEKSGVTSEYKQWARAKQFQLISRYTAADPSDKADIWKNDIQKWNADNPGHRITFSDLRKQQQAVMRQQYQAGGGQVRDPVQNELADY